MKNILVILLILCLPGICLAPVSKQSQIIYYLERASAMLGVDTDRVLFRSYHESSWRNVCVYEKRWKHYSYGALCVSLATARIRHPHITAKQLRDPWMAIYIGVEHLRDLDRDFCGNWQKITSMYVCGRPDRKQKLYEKENKMVEDFKKYQEGVI